MLLVFPDVTSAGTVVGAKASGGDCTGTFQRAVDSRLVGAIQAGKDCGAVKIAFLTVTRKASFMFGFDAETSVFALVAVGACLGIYGCYHCVALVNTSWW